jgi:hypothetical protein
MNNDRLGKNIAIEDLLSLKRAERPAPEFWAQFEKELRAKQLAAIVQKPSGWAGLARLLSGSAKSHFALGATALMAVGLLVAREYRVRPAGLTSVTDSSQESGFASAISSENNVSLTGVPSDFSLADFTGSGFAQLQNIAVSNPDSRNVAQVNPMVDSSDRPVQATGIAYPSSQSIISASLQQTQVARADDIMTTSGASAFESRILPVRSAMTEPLAQLATPKSVRLRDRYLGSGFPTSASFDSAGPATPEHGTDRIREHQLHADDFSRFDAHGDRLSIKL